MDYAAAEGMLKGLTFVDYDQPIHRDEMACLFARSLSAEALPEQNLVNWLPDVGADHPYAQEIFALYRAGVLTGNDEKGTFLPGSLFTRAEAAAIVVRLQIPEERQRFQLNIVDSLSREERSEINWLLSRFSPVVEQELDRENLDVEKAIWWGIWAVFDLEEDLTSNPHFFLDTYHDGQYRWGICAEAVDDVIFRCLGTSVSRQSVPGVDYENEYYYMGPGNGFHSIAILTGFYNNGDGTYCVTMDYFGDVGFDYPDAYMYGFSLEEALSVFGDRYHYAAGSEAVIDKGIYKGEEVYQLVRININYPDWDYTTI